MSPLRLLGLCLVLGFGAPVPATAAPGPIIGCPSLVNLRMLMRQTKADAGGAAAILGNDQADHLGCVVLAREAVTALQEHLTLSGNAYDCLTLRNTGICHWVVAGTVDLAEPPAKPRPGPKAGSGDKSGAPEKARR
ncbi:hypothetical protein [Methylobacterium sp. J-068]|uniref:hypothetical protein n=1 Tax=Methylobacterium sp. J-068 TaxID=2836649 RepID=UPI001FBAEFD2|nr:hypothetical protein [Methylobacterium sp. J-068]MCJ2035316.1 hypothetical protein [Methylobacterium sp. J-068]